MGCDIHVYIEYKENLINQRLNCWSNFGGRINPGRNYGIFSKLAGVRDYGENFEPVAANRGIPKDAAWSTNDDNELFITKDKDHESNTCTEEQSKNWIARGCSVYTDIKKTNVTHPDWHSHSWATADELEQAIKEPKLQPFNEPEYIVVLDVLRSFERQGCDARIVFWFDN